jgi:outer membrane protein insertion porin family
MFVPRALDVVNINPLFRLTRFTLTAFALAFFLLAANGVLAQEAAKVSKLGKIEVNGLERYTHQQVVTASGLQIGQAIDIQAVDEAANRLMSSGLFKKLSYRFRSNANLVTVTFEVEEAKETAPVVFDNFVWFSEQELQEAIRHDVPSFDGTAPESGEMPESIKKTLQRLLGERRIQGQVEYYPSADASGKNFKHHFIVKGVRIPVCALLFPGALDVKEADLLKASRTLVGQDYSREDILSFARANLLPIYRQRGHLRASFLDPTTKPLLSAECQNGVSVSLQVDEGSIYTWDKAEWAGNSVLTAQELSNALGMKTGDRADGLKIDQGVISVSRAYAKRGYIEARVTAVPEFDDANRRVSYRFDITEGGQFRMGTLEINGLSETLTEKIRYGWKLQAGEAFDASYGEKFLREAIKELAAAGPAPQDSKFEYKPNPDNRLVNVIINFK